MMISWGTEVNYFTEICFIFELKFEDDLLA